VNGNEYIYNYMKPEENSVRQDCRVEAGRELLFGAGIHDSGKKFGSGSRVISGKFLKYSKNRLIIKRKIK
jgi:hypothetical protein